MKNLTLVLALVLLASVAALLWRLERNTAVLADLARVQLADREEYRREEQVRRAAAERAQAEAKVRDAAAAAQQAAAAAGGIGYALVAGIDPLFNYAKTMAFARYSVYDLSVVPLFLLI